jgi:delta-aminolevulinic acid dehydratase/porphobilinogen synthase
LSGEYAMIKHASAKGLLDYRKAVIELNTSIRRAGGYHYYLFCEGFKQMAKREFL